MADRNAASPGSARVLIWAAVALVLLAGGALVALWPTKTPHVESAEPEASLPVLRDLPLPANTAAAAPAGVAASPLARAAAPGSTPLPSKDFFSSDAPEALRKIHEVTVSGGLLAMDRMKELYQLGKDHPGDARPHLLMGQDAMNRGWQAFAVSHYERAVKEDPHAREDPRMLKDLVDIAGGKREAVKGASALSSIYGAAAVPAIEDALAAAGDKGDTERVEKLEALSQSLGAKAP
jgi:hypothetical protein